MAFSGWRHLYIDRLILGQNGVTPVEHSDAGMQTAGARLMPNPAGARLMPNPAAWD